MKVIYEDNHIIVVSKTASEIVQGDKTGDTPLSELVKHYLKEKYNKPGNVFIGVTHRLDRPVSGLVVFAKTSKALARLNEMFKNGDVHKTYWAIVKNCPQETEATLEHYLVRNEKQNKSYAYDREKPGAKKAILHYGEIEVRRPNNKPRFHASCFAIPTAAVNLYFALLDKMDQAERGEATPLLTEACDMLKAVGLEAWTQPLRNPCCP